MQLAMGITAFFCVAIGVYPEPLYALLPYEVEFHPYTTSHVVGQLQLLCFALLAFAVLMRTGIHPPEVRAINLDTDWVYRRFLPRVIAQLSGTVGQIWSSLEDSIESRLARMITLLYRLHGSETGLARPMRPGSMVLWVAVLLGVTLVVNFIV